MYEVAVFPGDTLWTPTPVASDGTVPGQNSGAALLRRLIATFPGLTVIQPGEPANFEWGVVRPWEKVDVNRTVIFSMDMQLTAWLYYKLKKSIRFHWPKLINFGWTHLSDYTDPVAKRMVAGAFASFPTFANSPKTADEIRRLVMSESGPSAAMRLRLCWQYLGIDVAAIPQKRVAHDGVTVRYPAVLANERKGTDQFVRIMDAVTSIRRDVRVTMRLLPEERAYRSRLRGRGWLDVFDVGPKQEYYEALAATDVFLSTSRDESYGLAPLEQLYAGAVGVLPDLPWVHQIVPEEYPFLFTTEEQARAWMLWVVDHLEEARLLIDRAAGGSIQGWIEERHDARSFDMACREIVDGFWPER